MGCICLESTTGKCKVGLIHPELSRSLLLHNVSHAFSLDYDLIARPKGCGLAPGGFGTKVQIDRERRCSILAYRRYVYA